jgi:hypothetical protein
MNQVNLGNVKDYVPDFKFKTQLELYGKTVSETQYRLVIDSVHPELENKEGFPNVSPPALPRVSADLGGQNRHLYLTDHALLDVPRVELATDPGLHEYTRQRHTDRQTARYAADLKTIEPEAPQPSGATDADPSTPSSSDPRGGRHVNQRARKSAPGVYRPPTPFVPPEELVVPKQEVDTDEYWFNRSFRLGTHIIGERE